MEIAELGPDDQRLANVFPVLRELRSHHDESELASLYETAHPQGLRIAAVFDGGDCRAVAGYRIYTNMTSGRHLYVDDLVTSSEWRSRGCGRRLNEYLYELARKEGCSSIQLDSGVHRGDAHHFYFRERYRIHSFHFTRSLDD